MSRLTNWFSLWPIYRVSHIVAIAIFQQLSSSPHLGIRASVRFNSVSHYAFRPSEPIRSSRMMFLASRNSLGIQSAAHHPLSILLHILAIIWPSYLVQNGTIDIVQYCTIHLGVIWASAPLSVFVTFVTLVVYCSVLVIMRSVLLPRWDVSVVLYYPFWCGAPNTYILMGDL